MAIPEYATQVVSTQSGLADLENDWNRLSDAADAPNVFTTYDWFRAWCERFVHEFGADHFRPYVIVVKQSEKTVGIAPLIRRIVTRFGVRKLEFSTIHSDYNDLILGAERQRLTVAVLKFLARTSAEWDFVDLRELCFKPEDLALLESALVCAGLKYQILPEKDACPYLPIDGDADSMVQRLSGHVRRTLRKRSERAEAEGLKIRIIENPQEERSLLKILEELEWQKHLHRSSETFVGNYPEVFQSLFDTLGPRGWLYVAMLELKDQPVAFQLGFRCHDKLWDYTKAYSRSFSSFAPGTLLVLALMDYGFARGFLEYDFLRGEEPYKMIWSKGLHHRFRIVIWNQRIVSRLCAGAYRRLRVYPHAIGQIEDPSRRMGWKSDR